MLSQVYGDADDLPRETDLTEVQDSLDALVESATDDDPDIGDDSAGIVAEPDERNKADAPSALDELTDWIGVPDADESDAQPDPGSDSETPVAATADESETPTHARAGWLDELDSHSSSSWIDDLEDGTDSSSDVADAFEPIEENHGTQPVIESNMVAEDPSPTEDEVFDGREDDDQWLDELLAVDGVPVDRTRTPEPTEPHTPPTDQSAASSAQDLVTPVAFAVPSSQKVTGDWIRSDDDIVPTKEVTMRRRRNVGLEPGADGDDPSADGDDPSADGDDPSADGDDPSADGDDPSADGDDPGAIFSKREESQPKAQPAGRFGRRRRKSRPGAAGLDSQIALLKAEAAPGLLNRRKVFRVRAPADGPMQVTIETATASVDGRMRDLSANGVAVDAELSAEVELGGESSISLRMALDEAEEISVPATIRRRAVIDAATVRYGIAFEFPPDEPAIKGAIEDLVMKLQMEARELRGDADSVTPLIPGEPEVP